MPDFQSAILSKCNTVSLPDCQDCRILPSQVTTDHMVLAVGVEPDMELARSSNLEMDPLHGGFKVLQLYVGQYTQHNIHSISYTVHLYSV